MKTQSSDEMKTKKSDFCDSSPTSKCFVQTFKLQKPGVYHILGIFAEPVSQVKSKTRQLISKWNTLKPTSSR